MKMFSLQPICINPHLKLVLFILVWVTFAKNYSIQLFCDPILKIFCFSRSHWLGAENHGQWLMNCWFWSFHEMRFVDNKKYMYINNMEANQHSTGKCSFLPSCCNDLKAVLQAVREKLKNQLRPKSKQSFLKMSLKKKAIPVCVWGCLNERMQSCIHKYMNTFVYMVDAHTQQYICTCLHVVPVCGCTCVSVWAKLFLWTKEQSQQWGYFMPIHAWALSVVGVYEGVWWGDSSQSLHPGRVIQQPVYGGNIKAVT